jgi:hypothetical protein
MTEKIKKTVLNTAPDSEVYLYGSQKLEGQIMNRPTGIC